MRRLHFHCAALAALLMLLCGRPQALAPDSTGAAGRGQPTPIAMLRSHDAAVRAILARSPNDSLSAESSARIKHHINSTFDFRELSRLSLGTTWDELDKDERAGFVEVFSGIIEEQNFDNFLRYYREGKIEYRKEEIDGTRAAASALVPLQREEIGITYLLHREGDGWRVYDLVVDGASTAEGHRRRHARYIEKHSFEKLLLQLKKQLGRLENKED